MFGNIIEGHRAGIDGSASWFATWHKVYDSDAWQTDAETWYYAAGYVIGYCER